MMSPGILRRAAICLLVVPAVFACSSDPEPEPKPYLGHWESTFRGPGGEANGLMIRDDSTLQRLKMRAFDFRYSVFGDSLRLVPMIKREYWPQGDTVPPVFTNHFEFSGDTLIRSESQTSEWLVREGGPHLEGSPLVGTWRVVRSTGRELVQGFERFRPDSLLQVRIPAGIDPGTYQLNANFRDSLDTDSITMYLPVDTSRCVMTWRADTLVLTRTFTNGVFSFEYVRAGDSCWYRMPEP